MEVLKHFNDGVCTAAVSRWFHSLAVKTKQEYYNWSVEVVSDVVVDTNCYHAVRECFCTDQTPGLCLARNSEVGTFFHLGCKLVVILSSMQSYLLRIHKSVRLPCFYSFELEHVMLTRRPNIFRQPCGILRVTSPDHSSTSATSIGYICTRVMAVWERKHSVWFNLHIFRFWDQAVNKTLLWLCLRHTAVVKDGGKGGGGWGGGDGHLADPKIAWEKVTQKKKERQKKKKSCMCTVLCCPRPPPPPRPSQFNIFLLDQ